MSYVALVTDAFEEVAHFYGELLGFPVTSEWDRAHGRGKRFDLHGGLRLEILDDRRERTPLPLGAPGERVQIVVEVADLDAVRQRIAVAAPPAQSVSLGRQAVPGARPRRGGGDVPAMGRPGGHIAGRAGGGVVKRLIVGISGASGTIYGVRLLEVLRGVAGVETHLVLSPSARRTLLLETDYSVEQVEGLADRVYRSSDIAAAISSGSFRPSGMVVAPCSMKTVSGIATSFSDNLLLRAADVVLKERRRLLLLVRETPLHLGHLRLLVQVAEIGAIVMPPMPAFYHRPATLQEVVDQTVNRALDMLDIELGLDLFPRWQGASRPSRDTAPHPPRSDACTLEHPLEESIDGEVVP